MAKPATTTRTAKPATQARAAKPAPAVKEAKPATKPAPSNCACGCGTPTVTAKARFLSGHDARFAGLVGRGEVQPTDEQTDAITPALQAKIDKIRATATRKTAEKQARAAAKAAAKRAFDEAMAVAEVNKA